MINVSNSTSINKPLWPLGAPAGPSPPPEPDAPGSTTARRARTGRRSPEGTGIRGLGAVTTTAWIMLSWLAAVPRRLGDRLFTANDTEAYWRDWQISRTHGGFGRRYRDPSFDLPPESREI